MSQQRTLYRQTSNIILQTLLSPSLKSEILNSRGTLLLPTPPLTGTTPVSSDNQMKAPTLEDFKWQITTPSTIWLTLTHFPPITFIPKVRSCNTQDQNLILIVPSQSDLPLFANSIAIALPTPEFAPVTMAVFPFSLEPPMHLGPLNQDLEVEQSASMWELEIYSIHSATRAKIVWPSTVHVSLS